MHGILEGNSFHIAAREYFRLLNRGYPEKRSRRLVADHYSLNKHQRTALYRGIFPDRVNERRIRKRVSGEGIHGNILMVDLFNTLLLIINYLYGRNVFIATDLFFRDDGENFSRFDNQQFYTDAFRMIGDSIVSLSPHKTLFIIDAGPRPGYPPFLQDPRQIRQQLGISPDTVELTITKKVDKELINAQKETIATSDSRILDRCPGRTFDLAAYALSHSFSPRVPDLHSIVYDSLKMNSDKDL